MLFSGHSQRQKAGCLWPPRGRGRSGRRRGGGTRAWPSRWSRRARLRSWSSHPSCASGRRRQRRRRVGAQHLGRAPAPAPSRRGARRRKRGAKRARRRKRRPRLRGTARCRPSSSTEPASPPFTPDADHLHRRRPGPPTSRPCRAAPATAFAACSRAATVPVEDPYLTRGPAPAWFAPRGQRSFRFCGPPRVGRRYS